MDGMDGMGKDNQTIAAGPFSFRSFSPEHFMRKWLFTLCILGFVAFMGQAATTAAEPPRVQAVWATSPIEIRVVFDRPLTADEQAKVVGSPIRFAAVGAKEDATQGALHVAGVTPEAKDGRTLSLAIDPHPWNTTFTLDLKGLLGENAPDRFTSYSLAGVEATWEPDVPNDAQPALTAWWPAPDLGQFYTWLGKTNAPGQLQFQKAVADLQTKGRLTLRTNVGPFAEDRSFDMTCSGTLVLEDVTVDNEPAKIDKATGRARLLVPVGELPVEIAAFIKTGQNLDARGPVLSLTTANAPVETVTSGFTLPWAPVAQQASSLAAIEIPDLGGGDPVKGEAVFFGAAGKCADCHTFRGRGKQVGPNLSEVYTRDEKWLYRSILEPSAEIHPEFVTFTVAVNDGRILAGTVRAVDAKMIRVVDTGAQETLVPRADITEIRPSATSIMPVGLFGVLGLENTKDLIAYLRSAENAR